MQRGLERRHAHLEHVADLGERITEHIRQDHAATLAHREPHEGAQARGRDLAINGRIDRIGTLRARTAGALARVGRVGTAANATDPSHDAAGRAVVVDRSGQAVIEIAIKEAVPAERFDEVAGAKPGPVRILPLMASGPPRAQALERTEADRHTVIGGLVVRSIGLP